MMTAFAGAGTRVLPVTLDYRRAPARHCGALMVWLATWLGISGAAWVAIWDVGWQFFNAPMRGAVLYVTALSMLFTGVFDPQLLFFCLMPPFGLALYLALGTVISMARVSYMCDARGLTHHGVLTCRFLSWDEIETFGSGVCDYVRNRHGRTIRIALFPVPEITHGRRELRAEIERQAINATGKWS